MKRLGRTLIIGLTVTALGAAGTVLAHAGGWTLNDGRARFAARVAKMPAGVKPSASKQSTAERIRAPIGILVPLKPWG